jgi:hypothetical protein
MPTSITDSTTNQVKISDTIIKGDSYIGFKCVVKDENNPSRVFYGTVAVVTLVTPDLGKYSPSAVIYTDNLSVDESVVGEVSVIFSLPPSITIDFPVGSILGDIQFTFVDIVAGEEFVKTSFTLAFDICPQVS